MTAATIEKKSSHRVVRRGGRGHFRITDEQMMKVMTVTFCLFCFRDMATASLRYYLSLAGLSPLWFVPDILSFVAMFYFFGSIVVKNRSFFGMFLMGNLILAIMTAAIFMSPSSFAMFSSLKLFVPIFAGFVFAGRDITDTRWVRHFVMGTVVVSCLGIIAAPHVEYPWVGATIDSIGGGTRTVGKLWWTGQGQVRYGGFAGDSTMAAYMCVFPFILVHRHYPKWFNLGLMCLLWWAISISTSKTALVTLGLFVVYYLLCVVMFPKTNRAALLRVTSQVSFIGVAIPFVLIVLLSGVNLASIDPILYSMQDRITNSWQLPFSYLWEQSPIWLFTGCGLGCFSYPMEYTVMAYLDVPVDNFYISTYLMLGAPFLVIVVGMFTAAVRGQLANKLLLITLLNVYTITIQCYGPSTATVMIGYAFSDMFIGGAKRWTRRQKTLPLDSADPIRAA